MSRPSADHSDFNPRSPHGERLTPATQAKAQLTFQSTLPAWGATPLNIVLAMPLIHFNPRSPHGERHMQTFRIPAVDVISIHAPRMGSDIADEG